MSTTQKSKSLALIIPALAIQMGCSLASRMVGDPLGSGWRWSMGLGAGSLIGLLFLIIGLRQYAKAKGYNEAFGFLAFLSLLGVVILAVLPDKHKQPAA